MHWERIVFSFWRYHLKLSINPLAVCNGTISKLYSSAHAVQKYTIGFKSCHQLLYIISVGIFPLQFCHVAQNINCHLTQMPRVWSEVQSETVNKAESVCSDRGHNVCLRWRIWEREWLWCKSKTRHFCKLYIFRRIHCSLLQTSINLWTRWWRLVWNFDLHDNKNYWTVRRQTKTTMVSYKPNRAKTFFINEMCSKLLNFFPVSVYTELLPFPKFGPFNSPPITL